jgi:hypothetical protein
MIEWMRRIAAGFIGLHACGRQRLSQAYGAGGAVVAQWAAPSVAGVLPGCAVLGPREPTA